MNTFRTKLTKVTTDFRYRSASTRKVDVSHLLPNRSSQVCHQLTMSSLFEPGCVFCAGYDEANLKISEDMAAEIDCVLGIKLKTQSSESLFLCDTCKFAIDQFYVFKKSCLDKWRNQFRQQVKQRNPDQAISTSSLLKGLVNTLQKDNCQHSHIADQHSYSLPPAHMIRTEAQPISVPPATSSAATGSHSQSDHAYFSRVRCNKGLMDPFSTSGGNICNKVPQEPQEVCGILRKSGLYFSDRLGEEERKVLTSVEEECTALTSKAPFKKSILMERKTNILTENTAFLQDVLKEMNQKCPTVLQILTTICCGTKQAGEKELGPIVAAYCILMFSRSLKLSAFQQIMTVVAVQGHAQDALLDKLAKMNITLTSKRKLGILNQAGLTSTPKLVKVLKRKFSP